MPGEFPDVDDAVPVLDRAGDTRKARDFIEHHVLLEDAALAHRVQEPGVVFKDHKHRDLRM